MAQQLGILVALAKDPSSVLSIYMRLTINNSNSRGSSTLFWALQAQDTYMLYIHTSRQDTHTHTINLKRMLSFHFSFVCGSTYISTLCSCQYPGRPEGGIIFPETTLQIVVNHLMWVLEIEPKSSLSYWAISLLSVHIDLDKYTILLRSTKSNRTKIIYFKFTEAILKGQVSLVTQHVYIF